ncbi:MAG: type II toxin-antitoxin system prevent-host-death family antitoxin [Actinobacteria bacterium]|nr:type II toxin-antitoxin system prevent-host-death family antitoxin [Actinomycetota bacterium]
MEVGIRELRAHLSRWLEAVREGHEVVVTDRGKPVARLSRISDEDWLDRMVAAGIVTRAKKPKTPITLDELVPIEGSLADIVIERRESRPY